MNECILKYMSRSVFPLGEATSLGKMLGSFGVCGGSHCEMVDLQLGSRISLRRVLEQVDLVQTLKAT